LTYDHNSSGTGAVPGDVSLPMAIPTDEPLLIEPVGMLGDACEVYRFICGRLLGHHLTALFAMFSRHCSSFCITYMKADRVSATTEIFISNLGNVIAGGIASYIHRATSAL
jgi:hypothetical protein